MSTSAAPELIRRPFHHLGYVVDSHHVGARKHRGCYRCGSGEFRLQLCCSAEEGLAGWTDQDRVLELGQVGEARDDLGVLFLAFAEA